MKRFSAKRIALCGILAAMAVVVSCLGGVIPVATYVCVVICMILGSVVLKICGTRYAVTWYIAVVLLTALFGTDKEAVVVYAFLGNYPAIKPILDKINGKYFWKLLYFNVVIFVAYGMMMQLLGFTQIASEFGELGAIGMIVLILLGNVTFFLVDIILGRINKR